MNTAAVPTLTSPYVVVFVAWRLAEFQRANVIGGWMEELSLIGKA